MEIARRNRVRVSQATIYNSLNQLCAAGLLKRIALDGSSTFFDTNTSDHHHIFHEDDGRLIDLPTIPVELQNLPGLEEGESIRAIDIVVRVGRD